MKEIYTSGGSGFDRTEFYELFMQFGHKTLFSMPPRGEHSARKRVLADRYANSNIMREETIEGLKGRAKKFLGNCLQDDGGDADVYVSYSFALLVLGYEGWFLLLTFDFIGAFALFCFGWCFSAFIRSLWHKFTI